MKHLCVFVFVMILAISSSPAQDKPLDSPVFKSDAITFSEYPGLSFKLSEPYLHYQKWDTEHTGTPDLAIALEFTNNTEDAVSAIYFMAKLLDNEGGSLFHGTVGLAPMLCEPNPGNVFSPGYKGISATFITRDQKYYGKTGKLDFSINELKIANTSLNDKAVFDDDWLTFEEFSGLEFQVSEPYVLLDDMSGSEIFAIAMNFKNATGNPVKYMYFEVKIFDEFGVMIEQEIQEHNQKYDPPPKNFMDAEFPAGYEGIDKKFFSRGIDLFDSFKLIKVDLVRVE